MRIGTDGSAIKNPGPTGWAWVAEDGTFRTGGLPRSTNNVAELTAIREAILDHPDEDLHIESDSQYAINSVTVWGLKWVATGQTDRPNFELVAEIIGLLAQRAADGRPVVLEWVKAHRSDNAHPLNTAADELANAAGHRSAAGSDPDLRGVHEIDREARPASASRRPARRGRR